MPLLLIVLDDSPDLIAAMMRLAVVLLLGMLAWGMGRGPAGPWVERSFAVLLLLSWFVVCAITFHLYSAPESMVERLTVTVGLLLGPSFLLWAWRRRSRMVPVVDEGGCVAARGSVGALVRIGLLIILALLSLEQLFGLQAADLLVIGTGLALFAAFRIQGRQRAFGVAA
jgi:hypothetical protein